MQLLPLDVFCLVTMLIAGLPGAAVGQGIPAEVRDAFRLRIDLHRSVIVPAPDMPHDFDFSISSTFDAVRFRNALADVSGDDAIAEVESSDDIWRGESDVHRITVKTRKGLYNVLDARGFDVSEPNLPSDSQLLAVADAMLHAVGAPGYETRDRWVRNIMYAAKPRGSSSTTPQPLARVVMVNRTLGGIRVGGNKLAFTFALDGSFRDMKGRWNRIDYGASYLASSLSQEQFVETAIDFLWEIGADPHSDLPIRLETCFVPQELTPSVYALTIKGVAIVGLNGPNGSQRWEAYLFDI